jgi:transcription initiation factor TFIID TATA-box-binding protein
MSQAIIQRCFPKLTVVNVVATADLKQFVDLQRLTQARGLLYNPGSYPCAYLKDENTTGKVALFSTGRMISVGTKNYEAAVHDLRYAANRLTNLGLVSAIGIRPKLRNIVATAELGGPINLEAVASRLPHIIYEPDQFPGAIYFSEQLEGASILVFANGKVVVAGLKTKKLLTRAQEVLNRLADCQ